MGSAPLPPPSRVEYVVGFMFDQRVPEIVALIQKNRPEWQAGKLNGIGGKIEPGESPLQAMTREFREETALEHGSWEPVAVLGSDYYRVHFFVGIGKTGFIKNATDEEIHLVNLTAFESFDVLPNLRWLVPLAKQRLNGQEKQPLTITEGIEA